MPRSDPRALELLYARHQGRVMRLIRRIGGLSANDAEDLLQETFTAVWRFAARYHRRSTALTWIFGIAANLARNEARSRRRRAAFFARDYPAPVNVELTVDVAIRREQLRRLGRALSMLGERQRAAFVLCEIEGLSGVEAAKRSRTPAGTLGRWLFEARATLAEAIEPGERPPPKKSLRGGEALHR